MFKYFYKYLKISISKRPKRIPKIIQKTIINETCKSKNKHTLNINTIV